MTLAEWQASDLFRYLAAQPGRCRACGWHQASQGHRPDCPTRKLNP